MAYGVWRKAGGAARQGRNNDLARHTSLGRGISAGGRMATHMGARERCMYGQAGDRRSRGAGSA